MEFARNNCLTEVLPCTKGRDFLAAYHFCCSCGAWTFLGDMIAEVTWLSETVC